MNPAVTASQMKEIDRRAIEEFAIPSLLLMENAGRGIAELIFHRFKGRQITIFAGKGNNGGDGLVAARHLHNRGFSVYVLLFAKPENLKDDPALNFKILSKMKIPYLVVEDSATAQDFLPAVERTDIILDALFGVGLERPVTGVYAEAIQAINQAGRNVIAADIPSGLHSDTGEVLGIAVKAAMTATLGIPKQGLFSGQGPSFAGKVAVIDIGLPKNLLVP
ncbi:MAG: NAD(P)H-hydrate epimerase [Candidatus Omnitrophica bacterium]|nr:NAD(P)H-hydrate epimerase [Candidatus Omnitrophota bacterium]